MYSTALSMPLRGDVGAATGPSADQNVGMAVAVDVAAGNVDAAGESRGKGEEAANQVNVGPAGTQSRSAAAGIRRRQ